MCGSPTDAATSRVWSAMPDGAREALDGLSPSDLQTLLADVTSRRATRVTPAEVRRRWESDRLVSPAGSDPRALSAFEARLWQRVPGEFAVGASRPRATRCTWRPAIASCAPSRWEGHRPTSGC